MTRADVKNKLKFGLVEQQAFAAVKDLLSNAATLYTPDPSKAYILHTDASDVAVGASLSQYGDDGVTLRPIAFVSQKLNPTQRRWSTVERESYAVLFALKRLDHILFGSQLELQLFTDHSPLAYLMNSQPKSAKLTRWALSLSRYNLVVKHVNGKDNATADCLSRAFD